jgi:hypothetical protein
MSKCKSLKGLLLFQVLCPIITIPVFKALSFPAEAIGGLFVGIGYFILFSLLKDKEFKPTLLFWVTFIYVSLSTFLYGGNVSHWGASLNSYNYMGIPANWIHHIIELFYLIIFVIIGIEIFKARSGNTGKTKA